MKILTHLAGALFVSGLVACTAIGAEDETSQASEVQGGTKDSTETHNYAVGIANKLGSVCSGTLIAPNLVLTARHCVVQTEEGEEKKAVSCTDTFGKNTSVTNLFVTTEPVIRGAKVLYAVAEIATPSDDAYCGNDIALLRLTQNIPATEAEPAVPVVQFSIADHTRLSGKIAALGYGITSPNAADPGTRRIRQKIDIICLPGDDSYDCNKTIYSTMMDNDREFITDGYVCSGDSGGGAFDQSSFASSGKPYVLGALSRGPQNDTTCLAAIYSRTDKHADLIVATARKAAAVGAYEAADWVKGTPLAAAPFTAGPADDCTGDVCTNSDATEPTSDAPAGSTTVKKTTTCSATPGATSTGSIFGAFLVAAAIATLRRRRTA